MFDRTLDEKIADTLSLMRQLNAELAELPKNYRPWVNWDVRPPKVMLIDGVQVSRSIVGP